MVTFELLHPNATHDMLGYIPMFLSQDDPRPAKEQLNSGYLHAGGWHEFKGFTLHPDNSLTYPSDPRIPPIAQVKLREELIVVYPHDWVAIIQPDRSFEIARMD